VPEPPPDSPATPEIAPAAEPAGPRPAGAARNTFFAFLTQMSTAAFTAALTLYLVRALGPREFGIFSLAISVGALVYLPSDFGISNAAARFIAERRENPREVAALMSDALRLKLMISGALSAILIAVAGLIADAYGHPELTWPIRWVALAVLGQSIVAFYRYAYIAQRDVSRGFRIVFTEAAVEASASILLVIAIGGASAAAGGRAVGYGVGVAAAVVVTLRTLGPKAFRRAHGLGETRRRLARYAGALFVIDAAFTAAVQSSPLLIGAFLTPTAVGVFQAPARMIVFFQYVGQSVANGVAPGLARREGHEPEAKTFNAALRYLLVYQAVLVAPVVVWAEPITRLLLGHGYGRSADVLRALAPYVYFSGLAALAATGVNYLGEARRRVPLALLDLAIGVGLTAALLPTVGLLGAAYASDVGSFFYVPLHLWIARRFIELPLRPLFLAMVRGLLAAAAMAAVLLAFGTHRLSAVDWIAGGVLGLAAFLAVLLVTRELRPGDLSALRRYVRTRARR
jgi:O-antigen/teichoic acid export membrane protein